MVMQLGVQPQGTTVDGAAQERISAMQIQPFTGDPNPGPPTSASPAFLPQDVSSSLLTIPTFHLPDASSVPAIALQSQWPSLLSLSSSAFHPGQTFPHWPLLFKHTFHTLETPPFQPHNVSLSSIAIPVSASQPPPFPLPKLPSLPNVASEKISVNERLHAAASII